MTKPVVLIAEELSPATVEALGPDFEIVNVDGTDRPALLSALGSADAILVRSATQVDAEAIAAAPQLKVVARAGVGLDNVDIKAATAAGVMVVNAPTSNVISAAELAIGHIFSLARFIPDANASLKNGEWKRSKYTGVELYEKTIAIVGLGRIGTLVAQRLANFGANLIGYDPYVTPARAEQIGVKLASLEEVMQQADFITIHIPKTPETTGLIGAAEFAMAKPNLRIVNCSRGGIIDEAALFDALKSKKIAGAPASIMLSDADALPDVADAAALAEKWDRIREIRAEVARAMETVRGEGAIGSSLQAEVSVTAPATDADALRSLGDDLKFVFISSAASVVEGDALEVRVTPSQQSKCERCWHQHASVGHNAAHPSWCDRCVANVDGAGEVRFCA